MQALTAVTQGWRALELRTWLAFYDAALVRVLVGAGDLNAARAHVKLSLQMADETDIHFYDAELIRLRAQTSDDPADAKGSSADRDRARPPPRGRPFRLYAPPPTISRDLGEPAREALVEVTDRLPDTTAWPELALRASATRVNRTKPRIAVLGGGMAGLAAAWRLTDSGWRDRFESITVYQRGWRLGGKGASSRGENARIEEHGLHVWLGSYENAFALLRECYAELDRGAIRDPDAPILDWHEALVPSDNLGLADRWGSDWLVWPGHLSRTEQLPGEPGTDGREMTVVDFLALRAMQLLLDFGDSVDFATELSLMLTTSPDPPRASVVAVQSAALATAAALASQVPGDDVVGHVDNVLDVISDVLDSEQAPEQRRSWLLLSLVVGDCAWADRRRRGDRSARLPRTQRRGLRRLDSPAPRTSWSHRLSIGAGHVRHGVRVHRR